jgi:iron complex outermembrane receptor protein
LGIEGSVRYEQKQFEIYRWIGTASNKTQLKYTGFAYVLKAEYQLSDKHKISFIQSSTWRAPAPNELYSNGLHQGLASIEIGDSTLRAERSYSQSLTYSLHQKKHKLDFEGYYQFVNGYINLIPSNKVILTIRGAYPVFQYQQNNAALYGLNARWKYQIQKSMYSILSCQLPYGQNMDTKKALNLMPSMNGKLSLGYKHRTINAEVWVNYQSEQKRYVEGSDFMEPPRAYALIGFDFNYEFKAVGQNFKCGITGSNIGNRSYRDYLNRFRYFTDEPGINISAKLSMNINQKQTKSK